MYGMIIFTVNFINIFPPKQSHPSIPLCFPLHSHPGVSAVVSAVGVIGFLFNKIRKRGRRRRRFGCMCVCIPAVTFSTHTHTNIHVHSHEYTYIYTHTYNVHQSSCRRKFNITRARDFAAAAAAAEHVRHYTRIHAILDTYIRPIY